MQLNFLSASSEYFLVNNGLVGNKTTSKIDKIGAELHNKTDVSLFAIVDTTIGNKTVQEYINSYLKKPNDKYVVLLIITEDHIADIVYYPSELSKKFNKKKILSPFSFSGTILPILGDKKRGSDKYSAAILNGYADLSDQIAKSFDIELDNSFGNSNRNVLNVVRIFVYGFLVVAILIYLTRRMKSLYAKK